MPMQLSRHRYLDWDTFLNQLAFFPSPSRLVQSTQTNQKLRNLRGHYSKSNQRCIVVPNTTIPTVRPTYSAQFSPSHWTHALQCTKNSPCLHYTTHGSFCQECCISCKPCTGLYFIRQYFNHAGEQYSNGTDLMARIYKILKPLVKLCRLCKNTTQIYIVIYQE